MYFYKLYLNKSKYIKITLLVIFLSLQTSCLEQEVNEVCIEVDQELCPGANFENAVINLTKTAYFDILYDQNMGLYGDGIPPDEYVFHRIRNNEDVTSNILASASPKEAVSMKNRYVQGYEINYGFWSKDSFRRYSFEEIFEWKYGRKPTETELFAMTEQQAIQWFNERHYVDRPWYLGGGDPPRDVKVINPPIKQFCFDLNQGSTHRSIEYTGQFLLEGSIQFLDGTKCKLKPKKINKYNYDASDSPHHIKMSISEECSICN